MVVVVELTVVVVVDVELVAVAGVYIKFEMKRRMRKMFSHFLAIL